jgi:hypothetical protein
MGSQRAARVAAEAANHTTTGFFQGIGWTVGSIVAYAMVALLIAVSAVIFHHVIVLGGLIAAGVAIYRWQRRKRQQQLWQSDDPAAAEPIATKTLFRRPDSDNSFTEICMIGGWVPRQYLPFRSNHRNG